MLTEKQSAEDRLFVGWPLSEDQCHHAGLGTDCDPFGVDYDMKHNSAHCALENRSTGARIDPPCPLRIPWCRCSTGAGPVPEYYNNTSDPFMGAYMQNARDEEHLEGEFEDEEFIEEETGEEDAVEEETERNGVLEDNENERLTTDIQRERPLGDEDEGENSVEDKTRDLCSPQSLWPLFWKGLVRGWGQVLPAKSQLQADYSHNAGFLSERPTVVLQSSAAVGHHARGERTQSPTDITQLPVVSEAVSSPKPITEGLRPGANHKQVDGHHLAAGGGARSFQKSTVKKDSRGWEKHEKALVQTLMEEVILERKHAQTEERWKVISIRLSRRYSVERTWTAVKK